ncbi:hypothetical protein COU58_03145, partial [Candidatus Pacearchaeota archaeon CG10_big_fil_rev_8_21_14_0_10_32_42]
GKKLEVYDATDSTILVRAGSNNVTLRHGGSYGLVGTGSNTDFAIRTNESNRIYVTNAGYVGIGTTSPGSYRLYVDGNTYVLGTIYAREDVCIDGGDCISTFSDFRLKNITANLTGALEKLEELKPVEFNWNELAIEKRPFYDNKTTQFGLVAQDVQKVFPNLVYNASDGYLRLKYEELTPILVGGLNELNINTKEIDKNLQKLTIQNNKLKQQNEELNKTVTNLNSLVDKICTNNPSLCV